MSVPRPGRPGLVTVLLVLAGVLATPAAAGATVGSTHVDAPAGDAIVLNNVHDGIGDGGSEMMQVSGSAPGAADGDELRIICTFAFGGMIGVDQRSFFPVIVEDERFSTAVNPPDGPCTLRAADAGEYYMDRVPGDTDFSRYAGPRVLGGQISLQDLGVNERWFAGGHQYVESRSQAHGTFTRSGLWGGGIGGPYATGGVSESAVVVGTRRRLVLGPSGRLLGFGGYDRPATDEDVATAGLTVDGVPAAPVAVLGTARSVLVSRTLDRARGALTTVERAPVGVLPRTPYDPATFAPGTTGVELVRTTVQDHDGRQLRIEDDFRSTDGRGHRIVARYVGSGAPRWGLESAPTSFLRPWAAGDGFVVPAAGDRSEALPAGATTIELRGPQVRWSVTGDPDLLGDQERAFGAISFASAPSEVQFLSSESFSARFERVVPARGVATLRHAYTQDATREGVAALVAELPADPLPARPVDPIGDPPAGPPPVVGAPAPPVAPGVVAPSRDRLDRVVAAVRRALGGKAGRQLRAGRAANVSVAGLPRGRYAVRVRRPTAPRTTLFDGARTIGRDGRVVLRLRPTAAGRRYLRRASVRRQRSLPVAIAASWTAPGRNGERRAVNASARMR